MNKEFIPYKEAASLKRLGFDVVCFAYYENQDKNLVIKYDNTPLTKEQQKRPGLYEIDNRNSVLPQWTTAAPLFQQTFHWFRDLYQIDGWICPDYSGKVKRKNAVVYCWNIDMANYNENKGGFHTYAKSELACLRKLIEIIKSKKII